MSTREPIPSPPSPTRRRTRAEVAPLASNSGTGEKLEAWFASHPPEAYLDADWDATIGYYRKSSDDPNKQVLSIWDQKREVEQHHGRPIPVYFYEQQSATTFEGRKAFQLLRAFCAANRRPPGDPGYIKAWDFDRFSRECDAQGDADIDTMLMVFLEFKQRYGWVWYFVQSPPQGSRIADRIVGMIKFQESAEKSAGLKKSVPRGIRTRALDPEGTQGGAFWIGSEAPYPALRKDARTGRALGPYEHAANGTVLDIDPHLYPTWEFAARRVIEGDTPREVARTLQAMYEADPESAPFCPGQRGWRRNHVVNMLTNPALIGYPVYKLASGTFQVKAVWGALVDEHLFRTAGAALKARRRGGRSPNKGGRVLDLRCAVCEQLYHVFNQPRTGRRAYVHPDPKRTLGAASAKVAGCKVYSVDADTLEHALLGLILEERMSPRWEEYMREEYLRQDSVEAQARLIEQARETEYGQRKADHDLMVRNLALARDPETFAAIEAEVAKVRAARDEAFQQWQTARAQTTQVLGQYGALHGRIKESWQLAEAFATGSLEDRKRLFDMWVDDAELASVELPPPPGGRRWDRYSGKRWAKELRVELQSSPGDPKAVRLTPRYWTSTGANIELAATSPNRVKNYYHATSASGVRDGRAYHFAILVNARYSKRLRVETA